MLSYIKGRKERKDKKIYVFMKIYFILLAPIFPPYRKRICRANVYVVRTILWYTDQNVKLISIINVVPLDFIKKTVWSMLQQYVGPGHIIVRTGIRSSNASYILHTPHGSIIAV